MPAKPRAFGRQSRSDPRRLDHDSQGPAGRAPTGSNLSRQVGADHATLRADDMSIRRRRNPLATSKAAHGQEFGVIPDTDEIGRCRAGLDLTRQGDLGPTRLNAGTCSAMASASSTPRVGGLRFLRLRVSLRPAR